MSRSGRATLACLLALIMLAPAYVNAERTRYWRQSNYDEFEKGTPKGVALRSDGKIVLAPRFTQFSDPSVAYLWVLRTDSKGTLYGAGGSNAKVVRFDEKGNATTIFDSPEMAAQALAIDAKDNVYVGTSPDGKVYRIPPAAPNGGTSKAAVFFEPKTKYIWDLAVDSSGTLYVATGDKGEIYAVTPDGKGSLFYKSPETHIRSLALDSKGNLIVGTEPNGLVLRISTAAGEKPETRPGFVLYETDKKEVTALLADRAGNIYAASIGDKPRAPGTFPQVQQFVPQVTVTPTGQTVTTSVPVNVAQQAVPFVPFPMLTGGSDVYRIGPDGAPEEIWTSREDLVYSLALANNGKLLLGTGNRGMVIQLEGNRVHSTLPKTAAGQVTGIAAGPGGKLFVGTANPGKVFVLGPEYEPEGSFESQTFDAKNFSQWGRLTWWGESGATDGHVEFYVRSGNTSNTEKNWSPWSGPYRSPKGESVTCPPARFAQWKTVLKDHTATRSTPAGGAGRTLDEGTSISWVSLAYLPKNIAPSVDGIVMQNPGIRAQGFLGAPPPQQQQPVQLRLPPVASALPGMAMAQSQPAPQPQRFEAPPQGFAQRGYQTVVWSAHDDNDDDLVYTVYYRGEGEQSWKLLKDKVEQKFYSWDTNGMPDGAYYLKIVASDSPANPAGEALTGERESDRFEVDNTPPRVENLRMEAASPEVKIRFDARDSYSAIARAEYSLDASDWRLIFPVGRLTDSPQESYELTLKDLAPGEHTFAVRAFDQFENTSSAKITFNVESGKKR